MNPPEAAWRTRADVAWTGSGGRFVAHALSMPESLPLLLEGSAGFVWHVLSDGLQGESDIIARVAELAGAEFDVVADDVAAFLLHLEGLALAERS